MQIEVADHTDRFIIGSKKQVARADARRCRRLASLRGCEATAMLTIERRYKKRKKAPATRARRLHAHVGSRSLPPLFVTLAESRHRRCSRRHRHVLDRRPVGRLEAAVAT